MTTPATKATAEQAKRLRAYEERLIEVEAKNLGLFHTLRQLIEAVEALTDSVEAILSPPTDEPEPERVDRPAGLRLVPEIPGHEWDVADPEPEQQGYIAGLSDHAARTLGLDG